MLKQAGAPLDAVLSCRIAVVRFSCTVFSGDSEQPYYSFIAMSVITKWTSQMRRSSRCPHSLQPAVLCTTKNSVYIHDTCMLL